VPGFLTWGGTAEASPALKPFDSNKYWLLKARRQSRYELDLRFREASEASFVFSANSYDTAYYYLLLNLENHLNLYLVVVIVS